MNVRTINTSIFLAFSLAACVPMEQDPPQDTTGFAPVYVTPDASEVKLLAPRAINAPGKIYVYGSYLLINESGKGIHVYNNADPTSPQALGFIQILGNTDMAIKNNRLYVDHLGNLVNLSISDFPNVIEKGKLPIQEWNLGVPPPTGHYFECVDPTKGIVASWKQVQLKNNDCYAIQ